MEIKKEKFYRDFVERTKKELDKYEGDQEFTMLLNSTFGLLLVPYESQDSGKSLSAIWDKSPKAVFGNDLFKLTVFEPINRWDKSAQKYIYYNKTLGNLLRKLRNGLAHAHLEPVNDGNGNWVAVKIWNCRQVKKEEAGKLSLTRCDNTGDQIEVKDLEIEFTWKQLYEFASRISDEHLKYYNKIR